MSLIYHYTSVPNALMIIMSGEIRIYDFCLFKENHNQSPVLRCSPVAWFTGDDSGEGTVFAKLFCDGHRMMDGAVARFGFPEESLSVLSISEFSEKHKIDPGWWYWNVMSAMDVGSCFTDWRLSESPIPVHGGPCIAERFTRGRWRRIN
jgi:hypothetical protein